MYQNHHDLFEGLRKNFFVGFGRNVPLFVFMASMQVIAYILPVIFLFTGNPSVQIISATLISIYLIQRWLLDSRFRWNPFMSLLQPLTIAWYEVLGIRCLWDHFTGKKAQWKGRDV
jgi:chlorobactene glucosyltransferase